ncbi:YjdF family protein [Paenibacillus athensensis]|uniref:DUF2992 domain-containing protein n=1 Tax=Paenibacillus athensensis TaxID=1967502 RepID=A0A4Y8PQU4_9BACL|nr:YjdF family protein [Paenibacillus athensensis]MCD1259283.1 YjdF family protein [Paenibacillus athensensis]
MKLTVFFEDPFWVGVIEEMSEGRLRAARYVFGAEPQDGEVMDFVQHRLLEWFGRVRQSAEAAMQPERRISPKRLARQTARELQQRGVSTLAQQALQLELAERKREHRSLSREQKEAAAVRKRELARQKAKEKHRGR